ncbi:hypothetical protein GW17_00021463 [Ensete ventricosum]|nr:hypothetical protein GW17_00021463 [Ensete ventricosum]
MTAFITVCSATTPLRNYRYSGTSTAPKISPTPSAVDDDFYTRSSTSSLLQPLFSLPRAHVRATAHRLSIPLCVVSTPLKKGPQHCGPETTTSTPAPDGIPRSLYCSVSLSRVLVWATAHRLSVFCREGTTNSFSLSNDSKSTTTALFSLPFRSTDRPSRSSISSAEVNRCQTFTAIDNTAVSLTSGKDLCPSQELDLAGA